MDGEGYPYPALRLGQKPLHLRHLLTPFVVVLDRHAAQSQVERKRDAKFQLRALRRGSSTGILHQGFGVPPQSKNQTRWTVLEICTSVLCRLAFRATAQRTNWPHKNARRRFKICSAAEETKQLLLPAREQAARAAERSSGCPNRRPAAPEPTRRPTKCLGVTPAVLGVRSMGGSACSLPAGTERRDSQLFTTVQNKGQRYQPLRQVAEKAAASRSNTRFWA